MISMVEAMYLMIAYATLVVMIMKRNNRPTARMAVISYNL
ncbi:hypothetical protein Desor_4305 [Desulfosporosinus orientis DSM 765]|uniref:Uncharacterized protein n=1 Tax=Desulfosporosinus orientis (strain ATCC 19365 / DSM 765 / NCIMB 8382 / VKM B-1628 / Singapore I) TaxID=768706 RepID=G7WJ10_DESOD|nr:hypothetical protein Desor_4305 [Desulfosporosinus orientis DSM 765]